MDHAEDIKITYNFKFKDDSDYSVDVVIDPAGYSNRQVSAPPEWTRLEVCKCPHCPLSEQDHPHCPLATNVADLIDHFHTYLSYEETEVTVTTPDRIYKKDTSMQVGLYSILGLFMATSHCPTMSFLRPMARYHLPFASTDETIIRSVAFYLLRQYFLFEDGKETDFHLTQLGELYQNLEEINHQLLARISSFAKKDSNQNAVIILDSFAIMLTRHLKNNLAEFKFLFEK